MYNPLLQMTSLFYMVILLVYCVIMKLLKFNATIKTPDINHVIRNGSAVASPITWFITKKVKVLFFFVRIEDKLVSKIVQSVHFFQKFFENGTFRYLKQFFLEWNKTSHGRFGYWWKWNVYPSRTPSLSVLQKFALPELLFFPFSGPLFQLCLTYGSLFSLCLSLWTFVFILFIFVDLCFSFV